MLEQLTARDEIDEQARDQLEGELARAHVVDETAIPANVVTMNSELVVGDLDTGQQLHLRVVFPEMTDVERGWISVLAPIGLAVLGSAEGDELTWQTPRINVRGFCVRCRSHRTAGTQDPRALAPVSHASILVSTSVWNRGTGSAPVMRPSTGASKRS